MSEPMTLDQTTIDAIAERVTELIRDEGISHGRDESPDLIDATEAARILGVTRSTIYELAGELGAQRLGSGERPRLRFQREAVVAYGAREDEPPPLPRRSRRQRATTVELLPVKEAA